MGIIFGGPNAWKVKRCGDIVVALHWVNTEPAMCLFPFVKRLGSAVYIIPLNMAHTYARSNGHPSEHLIGKCVKAARVMGFGVTKSTIHAIATAILDNLEELVRMPPEPQAFTEAQTRSIGDATLTVSGDKIAEEQFLAPPDDDYVPAHLH